MRILKVTQAYYPFLDQGGPPVKVRAIARALGKAGHQVTILTADLGFGAAPLPRPEKWARCAWGWRGEPDGVEAVYLRTWARYRTLTCNPAVVSFCGERVGEFDLAHLYGLYDLLGAMVAHCCRRRQIPYVVEPMGMFRPIVRNLWLKRLYHGVLGQRMLRGAARLIATSEQERQELVAGGFPEAQVVLRRNGIEVPERLPPVGAFRRQWNIPAEAKLVLFLGRLVSKKSPELILEAFARWRKGAEQQPAALLVLAGPDEGDGYRQRLETLAARLGLDGGVLFTGPLYEEAKWAAYQDADVFVLPSQNENFGNTAAEAVACGTPVLVTDRCGIAPWVDQRAGLVVPHERGALQAGLSCLLDDAGLRQRLRAGCAAVARRLSWDEPLAALQALYAELAPRASGRAVEGQRA